MFDGFPDLIVAVIAVVIVIALIRAIPYLWAAIREAIEKSR